MEKDNDIDLFYGEEISEIELFSLYDPDFSIKYRVLSAIWAKLIQLTLVKIIIKDNNVALQLVTTAADRDVIMKTYMDEVRNVFSFSK